MKNLIVIFGLFLLFQTSLAQSPWTREKGKVYAQLGFSGLFYNLVANNEGEKIKLNKDISDVTLQAYGEYGITNNLDILAILPYKTVTVAPKVGDSKSFSGIGNITLGLKYKVFNKNWKISTGLQFSPKTSSFDVKSNLSTGFNASTILPFISAGSSSGKWYYFGNLGYGYMDNKYSDYLKANAEVGYQIIDKGHLIIALDSRNIISKEVAFEKDNKQWESHLDRQTYNAFGLKFNYEFAKDKFGANASAFGAFGNKNAPLAPSLNFGLYTKL